MSDTTEPAPWLWVIVDPANPNRVLPFGVQWTRPWRPPGDIAAERMAAYMWPYLHGDRRHDIAETAGLRCVVWRSSDLADSRQWGKRRQRHRTGRPYGESTADEWASLVGLLSAV